MPFSEEERKCPRCGGYENWNLMVHVNGKFYCQKCYIQIFDTKEDSNNDGHAVSV